MPDYASEAWQGSLPQAEAQIKRRPGRQRSTCATVKFVGGVNVKRALDLELSVKSVHVIRALFASGCGGKLRYQKNQNNASEPGVRTGCCSSTIIKLRQVGEPIREAASHAGVQVESPSEEHGCPLERSS